MTTIGYLKSDVVFFLLETAMLSANWILAFNRARKLPSIALRVRLANERRGKSFAKTALGLDAR